MIKEFKLKGKTYYKTPFGCAKTRKQAERWVKKWGKKVK